MRRYPHNSPEAAARIVALVLISDGQVCRSEFDVLQQLGAERALGLAGTGAYMGRIDDSTLAALMAEISDPVLQRTVLRLSLAAAQADGRLADGEVLVVDAAQRHWQLVDGEEPSDTKAARRRAS